MKELQGVKVFNNYHNDLAYGDMQQIDQIRNNQFHVAVQPVFDKEKKAAISTIMKKEFQDNYDAKNPLHNGSVAIPTANGFKHNLTGANFNITLSDEVRNSGQVINSAGTVATIPTDSYIDPNVIEAIKIEADIEKLCRIETGMGAYLNSRTILRMVMEDFGYTKTLKDVGRMTSANEGRTAPQLEIQTDSFDSSRYFLMFNVETNIIQEQQAMAMSNQSSYLAPLTRFRLHDERIAMHLQELNRRLMFDVMLGSTSDNSGGLNVGTILLPKTAAGDSIFKDTATMPVKLSAMTDAQFIDFVTTILTAYPAQTGINARYLFNVLAMSDTEHNALSGTPLKMIIGTAGATYYPSRIAYLEQQVNNVLKLSGETLEIVSTPTLRAEYINRATGTGSKEVFIFTRRETSSIKNDGLVFDYPLPFSVYTTLNPQQGFKKSNIIFGQVGQVIAKRGKLHQVFIPAS
jgi:hypothetical protein